MSKNTKIIAIVGGVLIAAGLVYLLVTGGLFGSASAPKRGAVNKEANQADRCLGVCQVGKAGVIESKACDKKFAATCKPVVLKACKDANYAKANAKGCAAWAKSGQEKDDD